VVVLGVCYEGVCGRGATGGAGIVAATIYRHNKIKQNNKRSEFYFLYFFRVFIYTALGEIEILFYFVMGTAVAVL